tara:strand:+ start:43 stop:1038 length:996 start_codon:yes stop_codon:yes gene_type:complete
MANGYSQQPSQQNRAELPSTNTNEGVSFDPDLLGEVSYVDGTTSYDNEGFKLTSDMEAYLAGQQPYVEPVEPIPSPIIGEIKFQKTIYSQPSFRKRINVSFNELNNKGGEIDIPDFFNQYRKLFYDIPKNGEFSHDTLIKASTDYYRDFNDPKDLVIDNLNDQIVVLELQLANAQAGFDPETGEATNDGIDELIQQTEDNNRRLELVGDLNDPYIYWEESNEYNALGLGVGLENLRKYIGPEGGGSASYPSIVLDGKKIEDYVNNTGRKTAYNDLIQAYEKERNKQNRRTYGQWINDIENRSSGNRTDLLKALMVYVKNYQMDKLQAANSA